VVIKIYEIKLLQRCSFVKRSPGSR